MAVWFEFSCNKPCPIQFGESKNGIQTPPELELHHLQNGVEKAAAALLQHLRPENLMGLLSKPEIICENVWPVWG